MTETQFKLAYEKKNLLESIFHRIKGTVDLSRLRMGTESCTSGFSQTK